MFLKPNDHILFYGDSITDWGRRHERLYNNYGMGKGFVAAIWTRMSAQHPEMNLKFSNRGIDGNRVSHLLERFDDDVLALAPSVVSILVGVNDTGGRYATPSQPSPIPKFKDDYRRLLGQIVERLSARLIICEPFLLDFNDLCRRMREDLNPRIDAVREVAREFKALYLPLDGLFAAACCRAPVEYWTDDGVHPIPPGQGLIAQAWIDAVTSQG